MSMCCAGKKAVPKEPENEATQEPKARGDGAAPQPAAPKPEAAASPAAAPAVQAYDVSCDCGKKVVSQTTLASLKNEAGELQPCPECHCRISVMPLDKDQYGRKCQRDDCHDKEHGEMGCRSMANLCDY